VQSASVAIGAKTKGRSALAESSPSSSPPSSADLRLEEALAPLAEPLAVLTGWF
jgi:hypothetical protein